MNAAQRNALRGQPANPDEIIAQRNFLTTVARTENERFSQYVLKFNLPSTLANWTPQQLDKAVMHFNPRKESTMGTATAAAAAIFLVNFAADAVTIPVVRQFASVEEATKFAGGLTGQQVFVIEKEEDMDNLPADTLLAIFNRTRSTPAKKFASPEAARQASFKALSAVVARTENGETPAKGQKATKPRKEKAAAKPREKKALARDPKAAGEIKTVRAGTKLATLIDLLYAAGEKGVSVKDIEAKLSETGQPISAASWLGYSFNTVAGYGYKQIENGNIVLVLPKGMTAPKGHTIKEAKPTKAQKEVQAASAGEEKPTPKRRPKAGAVAAETQVAGNVQAPSNEGMNAATQTETPAPAPALAVSNGGKAKGSKGKSGKK